jgi:hypothetical protein
MSKDNYNQKELQKGVSMHYSLLFLAFFLPSFSEEQIQTAAIRIFQNECSAKTENLVHWNSREEFISLGIGHFIWYWEGQTSPYEEQFPRFIEYCKKKHAPLTAFLEKHRHCPWKSREEFLRAPKEVVEELRAFLLKTKELQARFMFERLVQALPKLANSGKKQLIEERFTRVAKSSGGMYALIDYVNFKGEGILLSERYKNQGWGLLQVLEEMEDQKEAMAAFREAAKRVLKRRVANSLLERQEERWLQGWFHRIDTYK